MPLNVERRLSLSKTDNARRHDVRELCIEQTHLDGIDFLAKFINTHKQKCKVLRLIKLKLPSHQSHFTNAFT